jgi:CPA1 family monovalent cation:H+ antiporter
LELLIIKRTKIVLASIILLFLTLVTRYISVYIPSIAVRLKEKITKTLLILTWGGLRGEFQSLALSIAPEFHKDIWVQLLT